MTVQPILYAALLFLSGIIALIVLILAFPRRFAPGGRPLVWMMAGMMVWCWSYALHWLFPHAPLENFWLNIAFIGVVSVPISVFIFAIQLVQRGHWLNRVTLAILLVEPVLSLILIWTDPYHHQFFSTLGTDVVNGFVISGIWAWINLFYSWGLNLISLSVLAYGCLHSRGSIYRKQVGVSLAAIGFMALVNLGWLVGLDPLPGLDLTPTLFALSGTLLVTALVRYRMLDLVPYAHGSLLDQMPDGVLVVDQQERVVDMNLSAARQFGTSPDRLAGKSLRAILEDIPEIAGLAPERGTVGQFSIVLKSNRAVEVQISCLHTPNFSHEGYLVIWRDVTRQKLIEENLRRAIQTQSEQLRQIKALQENLKEQAIRDPLTGLFNRRFMESALPKEIARAERLGTPLSFLMIDIDHFKDINDQYGHSRGDQVLRWIADQLESCIRKGDWVARYGGEEFLAVLVDTDVYPALERAEHIMLEVKKLSVVESLAEHALTISIGISSYPDHGITYADLIESADQALYRAKNSGRNRVELAQKTVVV